MTGGTQGEGYSYADGVLTVNDGADITLSMVGGATEPTSDRIVVAANATATITLNGVSITGPGPDISSVAPAQSAIDVGENAHLILNLSDNKNKTLTGGSGGTDLGAPGIHVPSSASLFVQGSGGLSVQGGSSTTTYGGNGIGDKPNTQQSGGACGTVIILATGNVTVVGGDGQSSVSDGLDIGSGQGTTNGDDGQGIKPAGDGTYTVYGDLTLPCDVTIPAGATLTIPDGASLTVPESTTLTNNGTILVQGGTFTNSGTVNGNQPTFPSTVTVSFGQNGQTVTSVPHGSTVTITATMERAETAANALSADTGKVDFYLGAVEDGTKLNEDGVSVTKGSDGTYTAALEVTLDGEDWKPGESPYIITADFGGYAPEGDESGDSLAPNTGSAELTVTKAEQTEPIGTFFTTSSTENSITVTFTDVTQPENENGIEIAYAVGPTASEPTSDWTTATKSSSSSLYTAEIENLSPGTPCIFFARYKGDDTHEPSPAIASSSAFYTKPKIATQGLPNAYVGVEYSQKLEAVAAGGVAVSWTITSGTQPAGLTLNSDGTITGTPTAPATQAANFTVNATIGEGASSVFSTRILAISVTKSDAELGNLTVSGQTGFDGHFQYGDTITVTSIPERKTDTSTNALAEDTAALTYTNAGGEEVTLATATAQEDGSFKLTYDTKEKKLPIGEDLSLAVSYGGSDALNPAEETVTLTLDQAILKNVPLVSGEFVYGETLTVNYTPQDDETVTYQWYRGGEIISSATEASYTPTAEDIGKKILVEVIAADEWHSGRMRSTERMVAMAPGSIEIACDSVTYGEAVAPTVTSNTNEGADVTFTYTGTDGTSYGPSSEAPEDAGTYAVTATVAETATHTSATSDPVAFTIGRAALGASQGLALTSDAPGTATASWDAVPNASGYTVRLYKDGQAHGDAAVVTGTSHEFSIPEPGTYTVKVRANGSDNYADSAETEASLAFFSVSFVTDDAGAVDPQIVADGGHAIEPTDPTRDGYVFAGWYSDAGFAEGSAWDFTASTVSAATSLYAKWLSTDAGVESVAVKGEAAKIEGASISVSLPYGTEIGSADIAITPAAGAAVSDLVATADDCSAWRFTVTAEDGRTTAGYEIAVTFTPVDSSLAVTPSSASLTYGDVLEVTVIPGIASAKALSAMPNTVELYCGEALLASSERQSPDGSYALTHDTAGKGLAIGANTLTVRYGGDGSLNPSTAELSVTLGKLSVTASLGGVTEKGYDAGTDAPEGLTIDFSGALEGDEVTVSYASAAYGSKDVAAASAITATGVELGGADAGWYELDDVVVIAGRITPVPIAGTVSVSGSAVSGRTLTASYAAAGDELLTFQWLRDGESVSGATGGYALTSEDVGAEVSVVATAADANHTGSVTSGPVTVRYPYAPPAHSCVDWGDVVAEIEGSVAGGRVTVYMGGETVLPGEVLEALAGRDVTLVLEMDDGVAWEIRGGDVPEGAPFSDTDMCAELDTDGIPAGVVNLVTGESGSVQVTLAHDGEFGFASTLVVPLGEKHEGLFANLYRYDGAAGALRYEAAGVVDGDGAARLRIDRASQWLVALDDRPHALPFADAGEGRWYSEPVRWAWLSGAMGGYGDGSGLFGTDDALTRAQMAAVLYNLAGKPEVDASSLPADCDADEWYARAVAWALQEGIFSGYGDGSSLGPGDPLTREQAAAVLYNAAGRPGAGAGLTSFSDAGEVSPWARNALSWAVSEGVLSGAALAGGSRELQPGRA